MTKSSQQSTFKTEKGQENVFQSASKTKRTTSVKSFLYEAIFLAVVDIQRPNSGFLEIWLLYSQHYSGLKNRWENKVFNYLAHTAICCFILKADFSDEIELYDSSNKRSFDGI